MIHSAWLEMTIPGLASSEYIHLYLLHILQYKFAKFWSYLVVKLSPLKLDFEILLSIPSWDITLVIYRFGGAGGRWGSELRTLSSQCKVALKGLRPGHLSKVGRVDQQRWMGCFFWPASLSWVLGFRFSKSSKYILEHALLLFLIVQFLFPD